MIKQPDNDGSSIAQLKYPGGFAFSVCFSYTSQSFLDSYFVAVGREATQEIQNIARSSSHPNSAGWCSILNPLTPGRLFRAKGIMKLNL